MEWVLRSPQIHSTFSNLGFMHEDGYHVNENCNAALETILHNILSEDKYLRTYRRSISFGQNIKKDLIPLMIHAKEDKTIELLIRILVNVTIPIECLLSIDDISRTDFGRHTIFEINNLLASTKVAFTDQRATKVIIDFLKKNVDINQQEKLSSDQCTNISNCLLLLRNILHIPEDVGCLSPNHSNSTHSVQNQLLWNLFSQSLDKIIIRLMTVPEANNWGVTMVQVVALLYKDQHVVTLHKYLNQWLEASLSESSEDNESNTSPPVRGSDDSSPMLTSDRTSDSSDTEGSGKCNFAPNSEKNSWSPNSDPSPVGEPPNSLLSEQQCIRVEENYCNKTINNCSTLDYVQPITCSVTSPLSSNNENQLPEVNKTKAMISEGSDCGYGTQIENQESVSTSSSESKLPAKKPHSPLHRINNNVRPGTTLQDRKRKRIVKRGKANIINGLSHKTPTDDDISNVLKEFTVDFLLKGYNSLVQTLHSELLTNVQLEIDTSHFFWLVSYFLKFATQIELDLEHVCSVLSFDIVSYLTAEGVNLCEQFQLAIKLDGNNLKPSIRRLHLVVTAIREFVQAIEGYKKFIHISEHDQKILTTLQVKMCETEELSSLLVLLLRHYSPKYHTKQYLQDLIVTNHILLMFMDNSMKLPEYHGANRLFAHLTQFATPEIMYQYGLLLEDYMNNGEFVNDCIFTMMHHVGGELGSVISLFQPKILKIFTSIWKSEFEICDDWTDLIEYVINTFIKKPHTLQSKINIRLDPESFDDDKVFVKPSEVKQKSKDSDVKMITEEGLTKEPTEDRWIEDELSSLSWKYLQCNTFDDVISEIIKLYKEDGISKSRDSVLKALFKQNLISNEDFEKFSKSTDDMICQKSQLIKEIREDDIGKLCEQIIFDGKSKFLVWVQKILLETCSAKIYLEKTKLTEHIGSDVNTNIMNFEIFRNADELPVMSPVSYHALFLDQSVPLVPWNCEQATICKDLKFLQLLSRLGFHMPVDSGKVFIRIPHFWTADVLYDVASKVAPIDTGKLKFSINDISDKSMVLSKNDDSSSEPTPMTVDLSVSPTSEKVHKLNLAAMVNFVPMPCSSFTSLNIEANNQNWLEVYKITANFESMCETASVVSDLTHMYVSDEEDKHEEIVRPPLDDNRQTIDLQ